MVDSGSTHTHTNNKNNLENIEIIKESVNVANGNSEFSLGIGNIGKINNIKYTPSFQHNLLSVSHLVDLGFTIIFSKQKSKILIYDHHNNLNKEVPLVRIGRLFYVDIKDIAFLDSKVKACMASTKPDENLVTWHQRLHLSDQLLIKLSKGLVDGIKIKDSNITGRLSLCKACALSRTPKLNNKKEKKRKLPDKPLEEIDADIKTINVEGFRKEKYILSFRCARSKFTWLYFLNQKSEAVDKLQHFKANVLNQIIDEAGNQNYILRFQRIKTDGGGEFEGNFERECLKLGLRHEFVPPYSQYLNSYVESYWRILMEIARAFLVQSNLPWNLWTYAVNYANYILNRTLLRPINNVLKTSYEWLYRKKPDLSNIKTFGCNLFSHVPVERRINKALSNTGEEGVFLGFVENYIHGIFVRRKNNSIDIVNYDYCVFNEVIVPRRTVNLEEEYGNIKLDYVEEIPITEIERELVERENGNDNRELPRQQLRQSPRLKEKRKKQKRISEAHLVICNRDLSEKELKIIRTYEKDELTPKVLKGWLDAIEKEKKSIKVHDVFKLVDSKDVSKFYKTKWILTRKDDQYEKTYIYKARLVILGFMGDSGIDFFFTYAPVAKMSSLRMFLKIAIQLDMDMTQADVRTAFLNAKINEDIYVEIPEFFYSDDFNNVDLNSKCIKLSKALYGLKQAPREWFLTIHRFFVNDLNFTPCRNEPCIYYKNELRGGKEIKTLLYLYVDDFIIASNDSSTKNFYLGKIKNKFDIKIIGYPQKILGITIIRDENNNLFINQNDKIINLTKEYKLENSAPVSSPLDAFNKLTNNSGRNRNKHRNSKGEKDIERTYRSIIGKLNHISQATRPDITYAVSVLSKYLNSPTETHLYYAKRTIKYLYSTRNHMIKIDKSGNNNCILETYCDADWATDQDNRRSQTGVLITLGNTPIYWSSSQQSIVALSSCEAEIYAVKTAVKDTKYIRNIIDEIYLKQSKAIQIHVDNSSAIKTIINPIMTKQNRHMDISYAFIAEEIENGIINLKKIDGSLNKSDIETKVIKNYLKDVVDKRILVEHKSEIKNKADNNKTALTENNKNKNENKRIEKRKIEKITITDKNNKKQKK